MVLINKDETLDDLLTKGLKIIQKSNGFRFTLDSVLLAHFVTLKAGDRVVDLGTGTGVIPLLLAARQEKIQITGVEIQPEIAEMAMRSVALNKLNNKITILEGDLRVIHNVLERGEYQVVTANPPYGILGGGLVNPSYTKAQSRHELTCKLEDIVQAAARLLNYQGRFALIHRVDRLADLLALLRQYDLEPKRMRFIHSFQDRHACHVLLEARRGAATDLEIMSPLIVYREPGIYTAEILRMYGKEEPNVG